MSEARKADAASGDIERRNYSLILSSGVASSTAGRLVNPTMVLPFLYLALDAPVFVAGLLLPFMWSASLIAELMAAPFLKQIARAKIYVVLPTLFSAAALAALALLAEDVSTVVVVVMFLAIAIVLGLCKGISNVGFGQLFGVVVPSERRNRVTYTEAMVGGLVAIAVVVITKDFLASEQPMQRHITVLWAGIAATIIGAIIMVGVRLIEEEVEQTKTTHEMTAGPRWTFRGSAAQILGDLKKGLDTGIRYSWFRRYVVARILILSVTLAVPFLAIHASSYHKGTAHGLSILVIATSAGVVAGSLCWGWLSGRSHKLVMVAGSLMGAAAIMLALTLDFTNLITRIGLYAVVVFLAALAGNGVVNGRYLYFIDMTEKKERPNLMALSDLVVGVLAIGAASVLGVVAHYSDPTIPLMLLLVLSLASGCYSLCLVDSPKHGAHDKPIRHHIDHL